MKYTRKMSTLHNRIYIFLQMAVFVPLIYGIVNDVPMLQRYFWPPLIALAAFGIIFRLISYLQLTEDGLYVAPAKETIPYAAITTATEVDKDGLEIDYVGENGPEKLRVFLTMRNAFLFELEAKKRAR